MLPDFSIYHSSSLNNIRSQAKGYDINIYLLSTSAGKHNYAKGLGVRVGRESGGLFRLASLSAARRQLSRYVSVKRLVRAHLAATNHSQEALSFKLHVRQNGERSGPSRGEPLRFLIRASFAFGPSRSCNWRYIPFRRTHQLPDSQQAFQAQIRLPDLSGPSSTPRFPSQTSELSGPVRSPCRPFEAQQPGPAAHPRASRTAPG